MENTKVFLNPQGNWDNTVQYKVNQVVGALDIGLSYLTLPLVQDAGSLFYLNAANGSTLPTVGSHPAQQPTLWTLLSAGTVLKTVAPTSGDDRGDGYAVGTLWLNTSNGDAYVCSDNTLAAAVWTGFSGN